ncbi:MAG TPA: ABC-F family ATP-binding cassette domain-containing protein [Saprospiraceae bacterium]|nr:ABC-F family ATP-binding cassette domain-containing protein [Saprospiraceae bacterium]
MNYLSLENVSKAYGEKVLFDNISLQISQGQKVALVAKNGSGKSTLMRVIMGKEAPEGETARVEIHNSVRVGFLEQDPDFYPHHTVLEAALDSDNPKIQALKDYEEALLKPEDTQEMQKAVQRMDDLKAWDFEAQVKEVLFKLNISDMKQVVQYLSGGQKKRLALARLIINAPEFLILDEPTNHLDLDMIEWLEEYLQQTNLTLLMVTHDRYFLERICDNIVELDRGTLYRYSGSYGDFLHKKATRHDNEEIELEKAQKLFKKELEWVNRMPKARGTKAKSRVSSFKELKDKLSGVRLEGEMQIDIKGQRLGKKILELQYISKSFGDFKILKDFDYKFKKGERVGIVGPNGVGKTTFLKILTTEIRPDSGKVVVGGNTAFGYYTQSGMNLKEDKRVIDTVTDIAEFIPMAKGQKLTAPQLLERFLFSRKQQQVYVSQLSGGERRRLYLLTVLMTNPNFLILDEPTNDLDIMTLNVLEDFLIEFPGCVVIVTHDRYFMDKIVDHLFVFEGEGKVRDFNGDYSEYRVLQKELDLEKRRKERAEQEERKTEKEAERPGLSYEQRKELNRLEKSISKLETKKEKLHAQFNDTASLTPDRIKELSIELENIKEQIEEKEMQWMELADQL